MQNHHRAGKARGQASSKGRVRLIATHPFHWTLHMPAPGRDYRFDGEIFEVVAEIFPDHALTKASELLDEALISAFAEGKEMPRFLNFLVDGKFIKQICIWDALPVPKLTKIAPLVDVRLRHRVFQCECPYCGKIHKHGAEGGGGHREAHCLDASDSPGALMV